MENIKMEDLQDEVSTSETEQQADAHENAEAEQDPLKIELDKVQKKTGKSEADKARDNLFFNAKRAKELGLDPAEVLGLNKSEPIASENLDDDAPVTMGMLKKIQQQSATKTAVQLTEDIQNETERELTKYYLENRVVPSGNPKQDFEDARAIVNAKKNQQVLEELARKTKPKSFSSASSANANFKEDADVEFTKEELTLMTFAGLTKEEVLKARR